MNVLDENIAENQRQLLRRYRIPVRQIGSDVGRAGMTDDEIIPLLHCLSSPTFFTRDEDFYDRGLRSNRENTLSTLRAGALRITATCHSERSEESLLSGHLERGILRCAQDDNSRTYCLTTPNRFPSGLTGGCLYGILIVLYGCVISFFGGSTSAEHERA